MHAVSRCTGRDILRPISVPLAAMRNHTALSVNPLFPEQFSQQTGSRRNVRSRRCGESEILSRCLVFRTCRKQLGTPVVPWVRHGPFAPNGIAMEKRMPHGQLVPLSRPDAWCRPTVKQDVKPLRNKSLSRLVRTTST